MKIDYVLKNNTTEVGKVLLKYHVMWQSVFSFIIFLLNIILLISYDSEHGSRKDDPKLFGLSVTLTKVIMLILGILCGILWLLICTPVLITIAWMEKYKYEASQHVKNDQQMQAQRGEIQTSTTSIYHSMKAFTWITLSTLGNPMFIYMLLLGAAIVLGIIIHPFFYAFLVTYVIVQSPMMNSLLKAIWEPKTAILATIFLMILIVYLLIIWSYDSFPVDYPDNNCYSLWTCFLVSIDQTLKNGGIGNYLNSSYTVKENRIDIDYERLAYDNLEFLLITLLLIAIISGIIIDKFGELRARREENIADAKSSCFICGRETKDIDKDLTCPSFNFHVQLQHNLWDYVYFIAYLKFQEEHNPAGFSALEKYVIDKINKNDASWFPSYAQE